MKKTNLLILIAIAISICGFISCSPASEDDPVVPPVKIERPIVKTVSVNGSYDSVTVVGEIIDNGNAEVSACGVVTSSYGEGEKSIPVSFINDSVFSAKIPIKFGTSYGFRVYAVNKVGTGYGQWEYYSYSAGTPKVSSPLAIDITDISGVACDTVDNGNLPTKVTVLYGTTANYTDSMVIGTYSKKTVVKLSFPGLESGTERHFCFKAENKLGTVKTSDVVFYTGVKDIDGNYYPVVKIGDQFWIAKNLTTTHYNDGTPISNPISDADWLAAGASKTGAYCWYNNDPEIGKIYGALYNWYTISTGKLAPKGWHVPTYDEWIKTAYSQKIADNAGFTGGSLKETGYEHWKSPNTGATNVTGFTALPSGERSYTATHGNILEFIDLHLTASFWTADEWTSGYTRFLYMDYDDPSVFNGLVGENFYGIGVRIVKDSK